MKAVETGADHKTDIDDLVNTVSPRLLVLVAGGALVVAIFAMISMLLMVSITSDINTLQEQIRKAGKTAGAMQQEMAELRALLAPMVAAKRAEAGLSPQPGTEASAEAAADTPASASNVSTKPQGARIETGGSSRECTVTAGDAASLAGCLKPAKPGS